MTDSPALPPDWIEAADRAAATLGTGTGFAEMSGADWARLCEGVAQTLSARGAALPAGWEEALARRLGRRGPGTADPDERARHEADAVLAERGEVFGTEDDA